MGQAWEAWRQVLGLHLVAGGWSAGCSIGGATQKSQFGEAWGGRRGEDDAGTGPGNAGVVAAAARGGGARSCRAGDASSRRWFMARICRGSASPPRASPELIKERSGGTLVLDLKQPGDGTKPHEILDKVSAGTVDAGFATASFWAAKLPAASLFAGFPFGPDGRTYLDWFEHGNGRKLYQEMYDHAGLKVHVMPCAFGGAETGGWFAKEIKTSRRHQGLAHAHLRARRQGHVAARRHHRAGAGRRARLPLSTRARSMPPSFIRPPSTRNQGLKDKVKLIYVPGWHQPETVLELIVNKDRWDALTDRAARPDRGRLPRHVAGDAGRAAPSSRPSALADFAKAGVRIDTISARRARMPCAGLDRDRQGRGRPGLFLQDRARRHREIPRQGANRAERRARADVSAEPNAAAETKATP